MKDCIRKAARKAGWKRKYGKLPPYKGIGIGCGVMHSGSKGQSLHDTSAAFIKIGEDGKATLLVGLPELHDVGRAINPRSVEGQMDGQVFSAASQILYEQ